MKSISKTSSYTCVTALTAILMVVTLLCPAAATAASTDSISVGLVNCYPGEVIYELEGHTALHVSGRYAGSDIDVAVNYGLFDFREPNFVYRFMKGETDYFVSTWPWKTFVDIYRIQDRRIVEHPVPMDSVQTARFMEMLIDNLQPANCTYRYNYALNNCCTKPVRLLELALGDSIIIPEPSAATAKGASPEWYTPDDWADDHTFREILTRHAANYPWYQFGVDLALGSEIDRPITPRERIFAPTSLDMQIGGATVAGRKLTADPIVIHPGSDATLAPTPPYLTPVAVFWALFAITVIVVVLDIRRRKVTRWYDGTIFALFGVAGCVITFLVTVSEQYATSPNLLILWLNPLCLAVPACIWWARGRKAVYIYQIVNLALIALMGILWIPSGQHGNAAFIPMLGIDIILAARYIYLYRIGNAKLEKNRQ